MSVHTPEMRSLVLDGVGDGFAVLRRRFPFGGMLDHPDQFPGELLVCGRCDGDVADPAVFPHGEFIMHDGLSIGHGLRKPEMRSDVSLEERDTIPEYGRRIIVVYVDAGQKGQVFLPQRRIGENRFRDAGGFCVAVGLPLGGGAAVLDDADTL